MTNREWLNSLKNRKFVIEILLKVSEFFYEKPNKDISALFVFYGLHRDFAEWLEKEHSEE